MTARPAPSPYDDWSEATLQARLEALAVKHGWLYFHPFDSRRSRKGFPDVVLVHPERQLVVYAELKSAKGRTSPEQRRWLRALGEADQYVYLWYPRHWPHIMDIITGVEAPRRAIRRAV